MVAHRGASTVEPENTLPAFEAAIDAGADAVELDVRSSADGVPIVLHDAGVDRTTDGHGLARDLRAADIARLTISRRQGGGAVGVPTLEEALSMMSGRIGVDIELKQLPGEPDFESEGDRLVTATLRALDAVAFVGPVVLTSFDPSPLAAARRSAPDVPTGLLSLPEVDAEVAFRFARAEGHAWVLVPVARVLEAGEGFAANVQAAGMSVAAWTTDDPEQAVTLMRWGVHAIATNDPRAIVGARTAWLA